MGELLSKCCEASMEVYGSRTQSYVCTKCREVCDVTSFGCMKDETKINGDIVSPIDVEWNAQKEDGSFNPHNNPIMDDLQYIIRKLEVLPQKILQLIREELEDEMNDE